MARAENGRRLQNGIGLYIHIPFCQTKCSYCDFNTYAGLNDVIPAYVAALTDELSLWGKVLGRVPVTSIFFGGGTPSLLTSQQLGAVLEATRLAFDLHTNAEMTAEANPEDVTIERMKGFLAEGVDRLSMGVQTMAPGLLKLLGRRHTAKRALDAVNIARAAGFTNINLDLMYGLPLQTVEQWQDTLMAVLRLQPEHLSAYCLTLEEGTPLHRWVGQRRLPQPNPDLAADMYEWAEGALASAGYRHYEISNWALPGKECRHNLVYWRNEEYLGVGPGAHSFLGGCRFATVLSPHEHMQRVARWREQAFAPEDLVPQLLAHLPTVAQLEQIDTPLEMAETAMLALRLEEGLDTGRFAQRFGTDFLALFGNVVSEMRIAGLLDLAGDPAQACIVLTPRGRLLGNEVFQRLLASRPLQRATERKRQDG